jgi:hypothetical protein
MYNDASLLWVRNGGVAPATRDDQIDILLELGALDVREKLLEAKYDAIFLTEDRIFNMLEILLRNSGFDMAKTTFLSYNGVTTVHLLKPLIHQIKDVSNATIIVHRDRDYLEDSEVEDWKKEIIKIGAEPFVTSEIDVEGYFSSRDYIKVIAKPYGFDSAELVKQVTEDEQSDIISSYVNGRLDIARKTGIIGKVNHGALSATAAKRVTETPFDLMKGKRRIAKLRRLFQEREAKFEVKRDSNKPNDADLSGFASKLSRKSD